MTFEKEMDHVLRDLSAFLDGELAPERRVEVERHLAACRECAARSGELRATARLIASLPAPRPAARLVPPLATRWSWLRPLRSLSAFASGAFVLLFIASATLSSGYRFGMEFATRTTGTAGSAPAAAPAPTAAPAALEDASKQAARGTVGPEAADRTRSVAPAAGAPASATPPPALAAAPTPRADTARDLAAPPAEGDARAIALAEPPSLGSPWIWLALAVATAVLAVYAHRRLRSA
ncbi:MAG TPA: zf-HC2 domain-containing protein [Candidatus Limnocylindria bacterium]|nr:zf-HC2 domain-containing protein [Candidatus Limnocylindria bacterium]